MERLTREKKRRAVGGYVPQLRLDSLEALVVELRRQKKEADLLAAQTKIDV